MRLNSSIRFASLVCAAAAAGACAGGGDTASGGDRASPLSPAPATDTGPPAIQSFSRETRAFMIEGLHQFSKGDPKWETTRAEWIAKGQAETDFLVSSMWAALLKFQSLNQPAQVERARHELALIGEPAVPMMAQFLAGGTVYTTTDPETGAKREFGIDEMARDEASQVLSLIGAPAVPAVCDALASASTKPGKMSALQTLGYIGDRGGAAAVEPLLQYARNEDYVLRVQAVYSMRFCHDDATRAALIDALGDDDELVRKKAAESLMNRREATAVAPIRAAAERAREQARLAEATELTRAATWIEQHQK
jgi:hypothetical protein